MGIYELKTASFYVITCAAVYMYTFIVIVSARMVWRGPHRKKLRPEDRRCTLIIKNSSENQYLRQKAVRCLADHEIGTHFVSLTCGLIVGYLGLLLRYSFPFV